MITSNILATKCDRILTQACIVNAHVGSGKTTVLIAKIIYLHYAKGVSYKDMIVLTFTNKAANEIKESRKNTE
jgi:DNA helicase II / ATP-dependent DNA helicase PcrA